MIQNGMIIARCDDCSYFNSYTSIKDMRNRGWAVARNRINCYCPYCALQHRNVGRKGAKKPRKGSTRLQPFTNDQNRN